MNENNFKVAKVLNLIAFIAMVVVNALASILPINGMDTGKVSDSYSNLFAPTGLTFAIWGVIYILLALFVLFQLGLFGRKTESNMQAVKRIGWLFIISSVANIAWIFSWHYLIIPLSLVLMLVILISLILIYLSIIKGSLTKKEKFFVKLPFSIYFGWITVATIANATTFLVSVGWNGFGISEPIWTIVALTAGLIIGVTTLLKFKDIAYGLVIFWAYIGILIKHVGADGFNGQYTSVIVTVSIFIAIIAIAIVATLIKAKKQTKE